MERSHPPSHGCRYTKALVISPSGELQQLTTVFAIATRMGFLHYAPIKYIGAPVEMTL